MLLVAPPPTSFLLICLHTSLSQVDAADLFTRFTRTHSLSFVFLQSPHLLFPKPASAGWQKSPSGGQWYASMCVATGVTVRSHNISISINQYLSESININRHQSMSIKKKIYVYRHRCSKSEKSGCLVDQLWCIMKTLLLELITCA